MVIQFIELLINKMVWYPQEPETIWQSVISVAHKIHLLGAAHIINHQDDIDDLIWSLVQRFCYFLRNVDKFIDTPETYLSPDFFTEIEHDIDNHLVFFVEDAELDHGIKSKKQHLLEALAIAKEKSLKLAQLGIVSEDE